MLRITLYQNCILNETYNNVFSPNTTILEDYLSKLNNEVIELENTYQKNNGSILFDYQEEGRFVFKNIFDFNYMKIEEYKIDEISGKQYQYMKRYCFIQNIEVSNDIAKINYIEDIWSSYSDKIVGITEAYLNSSRVLNYTNLDCKIHKLKTNYDSNDYLLMQELRPSKEHNAFLVFEIQWFDTKQYGEATTRQSSYVLLKPKNGYAYSFEVIDDYIKKLIDGMTGKNLFIGEGTYFYEIGNIYVLPADFQLSDLFTIELGTINNWSGASLYRPSDNEIIKEHIDGFTIQPNFKNIAVGTYTNQVEIINNGSAINGKINASASRFNFNLFMEVQNKRIEITNWFSVTPTYMQMNGAEIAQHKLAREVENSIITSQQVGEGFGILKSIGKSTAKGFMGAINADAGLATGTLADIASGATDMVSSQIEATADIGKGISKIVGNEYKRKEINAPLYSTTKGIFANSVGILNAYYGLVKFSIIPENETFVKKYTNNYGYEVYEFINDLNLLEINNPSYFINNKINYDYISFNLINVYGSFPRSIAKVLNSILENGIKIWYNSNLEEDNYIVG